MRSTLLRKYEKGHFASSWMREAGRGSPVTRGSSSGAPERPQPPSRR